MKFIVFFFALALVVPMAVDSQVVQTQGLGDDRVTYTMDTLELGPKVMNTRSVIHDQFIVSSQWIEDGIFSLHDLRSKKFIGSFGKLKDFKNSYFYNDLSVYKNRLIVRDKKYLYQIAYSVGEGGIRYSIDPVYKFPLKRGTTVTWCDQINDSLFLYKVNDGVDNSLYFGNRNLKTKVGRVVARDNSMYDINEVGMVIGSKPDKSAFVLLPRYNSVHLVIVNLDGELVAKRKMDYLEQNGPGWETLHYTRVYTTDRYIYGLYRNLTRRVGGFQFVPGDVFQLHVWDWKGNPIKKIKLPDHVDGFIVTDDDAKIYGITDYNKKWILYGIDGAILKN